MNDKLVPQEEFAKTLGITVQTLLRWRKEETGPEFVRIPKNTTGHGRIYYRQSDIDAWIESLSE